MYDAATKAPSFSNDAPSFSLGISPEDIQGKRDCRPGKDLVSPYYEREVRIENKLKPKEDDMAEWLMCYREDEA